MTIRTVGWSRCGGLVEELAKALPGWQARELCPQLIFVSGHFKDFGDAVIGDSHLCVPKTFSQLMT